MDINSKTFASGNPESEEDSCFTGSEKQNVALLHEDQTRPYDFPFNNL